MKKNSIWKMAMSLMIVLAAICFAGCADKEDEEQTYYAETGTFLRSYADTLLTRYANVKSDSASYTDIKEIRNEVRKYPQYNTASTTGIKRSEVYTFLVEHGSTPSEAKTALNTLDSRGNYIVYSLGESSVQWIYAEKE